MGDSQVEVQETSKRPSSSAFKQQLLPAWQPMLTPGYVISGFLIVGIIFIALGIALYFAASGVKQVQMDYTSCLPGENCTVAVEFPEMKAPVYFYYQLTNYYQNHRRYVKSRNDA